MSKKDEQQLMKLVIYVLLASVGMLILLFATMVTGGIDMKDGCFLRYTQDGDNSNRITNQIEHAEFTFQLNANANYKTVRVIQGDQAVYLPDSTAYGQWLDSGYIANNNGFFIEVSGDVSLCKSYLPKYDLQTYASTSPATPIEIPRVGDLDANGQPKFLELYFPANTGQWRNIAEVLLNDNILIKVKEPIPAAAASVPKTSVTITDAFSTSTPQGTTPAQNCSPGLTDYHPVCGVFTAFKGASYINGCVTQQSVSCGSVNCWLGDNCDDKSGFAYDACSAFTARKGCATKKVDGENRCVHDCDTSGWSCQNSGANMSWITIYVPTYAAMPTAFSTGNIYGYRPDITAYKNQFQTFDCGSAVDRGNIASTIAGYKVWLTKGDGLTARFDDSENPSSTSRAVIWPQTSNADPLQIYQNVIPGTALAGGNRAFLQYKYFDRGDASQNTGGYVLRIQHTKCRRADGNSIDDTFTKRGKIKYAFLPPGIDANNLPAGRTLANYDSGELALGNNINQIRIVPNPATVQANPTLKLWLLINNRFEDYKDSRGQYTVKIISKSTSGKFTDLIMNKILDKVNTLISNAGEATFKNLTCTGQSDKSFCFSFFTYIRALLSLYVIFFGFSFLLGKAKLNQQEFITRIFKLLIVGGLINETTFDLFRYYFFEGVANFTNQIIANFGGFASDNPFTFLDELLSRVLFNKTFMFQMFALMAAGLPGLMMFLLVAVALVVFILVTFQAIGTYLLSKLVVAFLLGIAPIFLTFILFDITRPLFDKWVRVLFRYILEPIVVILGIAMLAQLFTVYLDRAIGFSVCFKCAIPFKVSNAMPYLQNFPSDFANIVIFCIPWFAPWGLDHRYGIIGLSMGDIIGLMILAFVAYNYLKLAVSLVEAITGEVGGASTAQMASNASATFVKALDAPVRAGVEKYQEKAAVNKAADGIRKKRAEDAQLKKTAGEALDKAGYTPDGKPKDKASFTKPDDKASGDSAGFTSGKPGGEAGATPGSGDSASFTSKPGGEGSSEGAAASGASGPASSEGAANPSVRPGIGEGQSGGATSETPANSGVETNTGGGGSSGEGANPERATGDSSSTGGEGSAGS